jgi:hypothetical protein
MLPQAVSLGGDASLCFFGGWSYIERSGSPLITTSPELDQQPQETASVTQSQDNTQPNDGEPSLLDAESLACAGLARADDPFGDPFRRLRQEAWAEYIARRRIADAEISASGLPKPKPSRKPGLDRLIAQIAQAEKKTGKIVSCITMPDGTTLNFGEPEPSAATNPWLADLEKRQQR